MTLYDFIDFEFITLNTKHGSRALSAILIFAGVGFVAGRVLSTGYILTGIHLTEKIAISACIIYLTVIILLELLTRLVRRFQRFWATWKGGGNALLVA